MGADTFARVATTDAACLWEWLAESHAQPASVWLATWKVAHPARHVLREAVLEAPFAHGCAVGRRMSLDADRPLRLISPRKQQAWAAQRKARAERPMAEGRMRAAGLAAVGAGRASALWRQSDPIDALQEPEGPVDAFDASKDPIRWRAFAPSCRRKILRWSARAKRPETRACRVGIVASCAARG